MPTATTGFDWKKVIGVLAPTLGTALGGPLGGMAFSQIAAAVLGPEAGATATPDQVQSALVNGQLTGEQILALKQADRDFEVKMKEFDVKLVELNNTQDLAYVADTDNARKSFSANENVFVLGVCILVGFAVLMGLVLTGCFYLMTGKVSVDAAMLTACAGMIGTVVGYVAANAQQVVSFFFGSSKGSKDNGDRLGAALTQSLNQQATAAK